MCFCSCGGGRPFFLFCLYRHARIRWTSLWESRCIVCCQERNDRHSGHAAFFSFIGRWGREIFECFGLGQSLGLQFLFYHFQASQRWARCSVPLNINLLISKEALTTSSLPWCCQDIRSYWRYDPGHINKHSSITSHFLSDLYFSYSL